MSESQPGSGHGGLAARWLIAVPLSGLGFHTAGTCHGTAEADQASDMVSLHPGV